ncbi:hypothetical protein DCAR_0623332 [Daucus carota subsp. sativus]|uniref:Uncharacterized protein n=1 Tax=Daucus carota subsp. sativus TaxID=79200 RepID=A0A175YBW4_DAUCS|nr:hypothetical protein DCAR_0623332 [Daucus carota subsp. sativus]
MDAIDRLSVVDNSKIMWKVRVCVTRIWPSRKKNGVIVRQNLLLLDAESTIIDVIPQDDVSIPMHKFKMIPLGKLNEYVSGRYPHLQGHFSADVIGVVEDLEPIHVLQTRDGQVGAIRFSIFDGRLRQKVRIYGPFNPDATALYDNQFFNPKIVILAGTRISEYKGNINITNLSSTKIYINLECPEVHNFRQW